MYDRCGMRNHVTAASDTSKHEGIHTFYLEKMQSKIHWSATTVRKMEMVRMS